MPGRRDGTAARASSRTGSATFRHRPAGSVAAPIRTSSSGAGSRGSDPRYPRLPFVAGRSACSFQEAGRSRTGTRQIRARTPRGCRAGRWSNGVRGWSLFRPPAVSVELEVVRVAWPARRPRRDGRCQLAYVLGVWSLFDVGPQFVGVREATEAAATGHRLDVLSQVVVSLVRLDGRLQGVHILRVFRLYLQVDAGNVLLGLDVLLKRQRLDPELLDADLADVREPGRQVVHFVEPVDPGVVPLLVRVDLLLILLQFLDDFFVVGLGLDQSG